MQTTTKKLRANFTFEQTNVEEMTEILIFLTRKIKKKKYAIQTFGIAAAEFCGHFLTSIIDVSLANEYIPRAWKLATVEFRGINLLPVDEKVMRNVVKK